MQKRFLRSVRKHIIRRFKTMNNFFDELNNYDSEVYAACNDELTRQQNNIELIASENIVSKAVLLAAGTVLTNKYAEGYPGKDTTAVAYT